MAPALEFHSGGVPARVEVSAGPTFRIRRFRLFVDARLLYDELPGARLTPDASVDPPPLQLTPSQQASRGMWPLLAMVVGVSLVSGLIRRLFF